MPSSADPAEPTEYLGCELTRTKSGESAITRDTSRDLWLRFDDAPQGKSTEWTNEKHSMYLDSLEASFVHELYQSMHSDGQGMKKNSRMPFSSDQFMVLGHECQKNVNCETNKPLLDSTADSRVVVENPGFPHFTYSGKCHSVACPESHECVTVRNNGSQSRGKLSCFFGSTRSLNHRDLFCSSEEVSDQNFEEAAPRGNSSRKSTTKRLKTAATDRSRKDKRSKRMP